METILILGASRGLGAALVAHAANQGAAITGWARKTDRLRQLAGTHSSFEPRTGDLARESDQAAAIADAVSGRFDRIYVILGGGPYGPFHERPFKAHAWAWEVSFVFPAKLLHALAERQMFIPVTVTGSAIAEASPDPGAASYAAAKHALRGLTTTLNLEYPNWDLRLFSPGYLDTELLPPNAPPRRLGVYDPKLVAAELWAWTHGGNIGGQRVYPRHPVC